MLPHPKTKKLIFDQIGYDPYPEQLEAHDETEARLLLIAGGERAGKSRWAAAELTATMLLPGNQIAACGQDYDQAKKEVRYVIDDLVRLDALAYESTPKQGRWEIRSKTGSRLETVSLQDGAGELTARGEPYDLVLVAEAGRVQDGSILRAARGRVAETRGRVLLVGTLWDNFGWYSELYDELAGDNLWDGKRYSIPSWANINIFPGGRSDPEILHWEATMEPTEFARFVAARKVKPPAIIYQEFDRRTHVSFDVQYDPHAPVDLSIDPGYFPSRYAVLAIQPSVNTYGQECVNVLDEIWVNHLVHHEIIAEAKERFWWDNVHRILGGHETRQHAATRSTREVWIRNADKYFETCPPYADRERIMRVKTLLVDPYTKAARLLLHPRCIGLSKEFNEWRRKTDKDGQVTSETPIDEMSDALDALGNYVLHEFGPTDRPAGGGRSGGYTSLAKG